MNIIIWPVLNAWDLVVKILRRSRPKWWKFRTRWKVKLGQSGSMTELCQLAEASGWLIGHWSKQIIERSDFSVGKVGTVRLAVVTPEDLGYTTYGGTFDLASFLDKAKSVGFAECPDEVVLVLARQLRIRGQRTLIVATRLFSIMPGLRPEKADLLALEGSGSCNGMNIATKQVLPQAEETYCDMRQQFVFVRS